MWGGCNIHGVFLGYYSHFFACAHHLMCCVRSHAPLFTTSWCYVIARWHHIEHWWCHFMTCNHDIIGLAYKRCCTAPIGVHLVLHIWLFTFGYSCMLGLMCCHVPTFLEPTSFKCNWQGCCYCCECLVMHQHPYTLQKYPMSIASPSSCMASTGPPYLWLVPVCTIFVVEGLHHQKCIAARLTPCCPA